ncbi:DUF6520 family protein [Flavobacterium sedimenticola]|uniref:DUF6520 family protein n=1 Tax=Flavobacterium sedimenticola TaxID=3043286 RepID=A0ABT6XSC7_9FLAO|nr:DUF6520 family protein [Flavobacterium sedimenticola]MDI9257956.1 DUF6520 family protein [Flavobacterium sedimenticola]
MKNAKLFLSVALFSVAAVGAFATTASKTKAVTVSGYIKQGPNCIYKNECSADPTLVLCTETNTGGAQVFGMDPNDCTVDLWRIH